MVAKIRLFLSAVLHLVMLGLMLSLSYGSWVYSLNSLESVLPWYSTMSLVLIPFACLMSVGALVTASRIVNFGKELFHAQDRG